MKIRLKRRAAVHVLAVALQVGIVGIPDVLSRDADTLFPVLIAVCPVAIGDHNFNSFSNKKILRKYERVA